MKQLAFLDDANLSLQVELLHEKDGKSEAFSQDGLWKQVFFGNDGDLNL